MEEKNELWETGGAIEQVAQVEMKDEGGRGASQPGVLPPIPAMLKIE